METDGLTSVICYWSQRSTHPDPRGEDTDPTCPWKEREEFVALFNLPQTVSFSELGCGLDEAGMCSFRPLD